MTQSVSPDSQVTARLPMRPSNLGLSFATPARRRRRSVSNRRVARLFRRGELPRFSAARWHQRT